MGETDPSAGMVVPFIFFLLCIAVMPFAAGNFWAKHYHHVSFFLSFIVFLYYVSAFKGDGAARMFLSFLDYISFMALVGSLFVIAGGIHIDINGHGTPLINTAILFVGALLANIIGTTGASMLLIRPFVRINKKRVQGFHVMFFIFIVSNVGGMLTPLGDPPLFLGYLKGVPFFWLLAQPRIIGAWLFCVGMLLIMFFFLDRHYYLKGVVHSGPISISADDARDDDDEEEGENGSGEGGKKKKQLELDSNGKSSLNGDGKGENGEQPSKSLTVRIDDDDEEDADEKLLVPGQQLASPTRPVHVLGLRNFGFLFAIILLVLVQKASFISNLETTQAAESGLAFAISVLMLIVAFCAYKFGDATALSANSFNFGPIKEVGFLFFGIFQTMVPALDILQYHAKDLDITSPRAFYWASGALSSVLDNAPTYLNFMAAAFGLQNRSLDSSADMDFLLKQSEFVKYVIAVSLGSVFFGANTYIGNGPNMMVKSLAEEGGAPCPTFFEYIYKYSMPILMPLFLIVSFMCVQG
jgi:Na+/H+ antiporter NhaD/arsenite permease-like protein